MCGKDPFCFLNKFFSYGIYRPCSSLANFEVRRFPVESGKGTFQSLVEIVSISESCLQAVRRCKKSSVCSTGLWKMNQCQMMRCFGMYFFFRFFFLGFLLEDFERGMICHIKRRQNVGCKQTFSFLKCKDNMLSFLLKVMFGTPTVDGRTPAPPWMYKTL